MNIKIKTGSGLILYYGGDNFTKILEQIKSDDISDAELLDVTEQSSEEVLEALKVLLQYSNNEETEVIVNYLQNMGRQFCAENVEEARCRYLGEFEDAEDAVRYYLEHYMMFQDSQIDFLYSIVEDLTDLIVDKKLYCINQNHYFEYGD